VTDGQETPDEQTDEAAAEAEAEVAADVAADVEQIVAESAVEKVPVADLVADDVEGNAADAPRADTAERDRDAKRAIEAVVLATIEPVEARLLAQLVEIPVATVERLCDELAAEYEEQGRGFVLAQVAGGYRYQTHPDLGAYVERFVLEGQHARLSAPALETLAIIAYKQPISRGQMSAIRGVNVEATLNTLLQRGYVQEVGRDPGPGAAVLYGTTRTFLERLGLSSLDDLPPLGDFVPDPSVVEALERGLRITASEAGASSDADSAADVDASLPAGDEGSVEGSAEDVSEDANEDANDDANDDAPDPVAQAEAEAEALLADDPAGPLD
jgi:segregation and condensation protein B